MAINWTKVATNIGLTLFFSSFLLTGYLIYEITQSPSNQDDIPTIPLEAFQALHARQDKFYATTQPTQRKYVPFHEANRASPPTRSTGSTKPSSRTDNLGNPIPEDFTTQKSKLPPMPPSDWGKNGELDSHTSTVPTTEMTAATPSKPPPQLVNGRIPHDISHWPRKTKSTLFARPTGEPVYFTGKMERIPPPPPPKRDEAR